MKFLVAVGGFFLALVFKAPFFVALLLAGAAGLLVHFAARQDRALKDAHLPAQPTTAYRPEPAQLAASPRTPDEVPDGSNAGELRAYLRRLTYRIHALEQDLATL